eukprot:CAMPEP_0172592876 /NCGR_PEP_ID=MMETSP1068-20121228/12007_1 /TAXON_ID=35684 /ORGANISM="Pseudopedinella elastica, Strain CCMP716" /LENGTH=97 /DNA_ID=CAMNT_0013390127 /DNA_START=348 /DNA_END=638 /DNA_ORIENTATION=-
MYSRRRGARRAPHRDLRETHMGRETTTSNAVFCSTEVKELKGGCGIVANSPSGRRRGKVSEYGKYNFMAAKRGRGQILVQISIRENEKQIQFDIPMT